MKIGVIDFALKWCIEFSFGRLVATTGRQAGGKITDRSLAVTIISQTRVTCFSIRISNLPLDFVTLFFYICKKKCSAAEVALKNNM